ncbi:GNAT family N-acetyltransferase [Virgibacillus sp. NKC19-3]|uniref:GNAT family N-acetyltransferase n=1 Tax=Virgibacillus saliphilus TaxID=2831674 RepID=UPI001C9B1DD8|nr:GNAT family N-acetyltransferase [Virgibacillus sp. NKC19-3]MBY7142027.1 GNAT family N-acetyltransferase [Virgibacillus sp. NKC19-3]
MATIVRKATFRETQEIRKYALKVLKESTMGYVEPSQEKAVQMLSPFLSDGGYYVVSIENNNLQGWIGLGSIMDNHTEEMVGFIPEVYVLPAYRKQGVAEQLCKEAFQQLKLQGYKKVQLQVFSGNQVRNLYEKLGFQEISSLMAKEL